MRVTNAATALAVLQQARTIDLAGWAAMLQGNKDRAEQLANKAAALFIKVEDYLSRLQ